MGVWAGGFLKPSFVDASWGIGWGEALFSSLLQRSNTFVLADSARLPAHSCSQLFQYCRFCTLQFSPYGQLVLYFEGCLLYGSFPGKLLNTMI